MKARVPERPVAGVGTLIPRDGPAGEGDDYRVGDVAVCGGGELILCYQQMQGCPTRKDFRDRPKGDIMATDYACHHQL